MRPMNKSLPSRPAGFVVTELRPGDTVRIYGSAEAELHKGKLFTVRVVWEIGDGNWVAKLKQIDGETYYSSYACQFLELVREPTNA